MKREGLGCIQCEKQVLYNTFIGKKSILLYEKAAYIRDRSIYRHSYVPGLSDNMIQTSLEVRKQDDSLPDSKALYSIICSIHKAICLQYAKEQYKEYVYYYLHFNQVDCKELYAENLGYSWDALEEMGGYRNHESVNSAIAQMMELYPQDTTLAFYRKYFKPLIDWTRDELSGFE